VREGHAGPVSLPARVSCGPACEANLVDCGTEVREGIGDASAFLAAASGSVSLACAGKL